MVLWHEVFLKEVPSPINPLNSVFYQNILEKTNTLGNLDLNTTLKETEEVLNPINSN